MWEFIWRWETLWYLLLVLYVPSCIGLIAIVLLQKGKGVGFAGAFGMGGGSDTIFGPRGGKTLPQRLTYVMAAIFMIFAFVMSLISGRLGKGVAPETLSEDSIGITEVDTSGLPDLGSGLEEETAEGEEAAQEPVPEAAPEEQPAAETAPAEQPTPEAAPEEQPAVETTPAEQPAPEAAPAELPPAEATPAEQPTPEAAPAEQPSPEPTPEVDPN